MDKPLNLPRAKPHPRVKRRNVQLGPKRTTIMMENEMWEALEEICAVERRDLNEICAELALRNRNSENFTSVLRVFILNYFWKGTDVALRQMQA